MFTDENAEMLFELKNEVLQNFGVIFQLLAAGPSANFQALLEVIVARH